MEIRARRYYHTPIQYVCHNKHKIRMDNRRKLHKYLYAMLQRIKPKETILSSTNSIRSASPKTQDSQMDPGVPASIGVHFQTDRGAPYHHSALLA